MLIAYIGTKEQRNRMNAYCYTERKTESTYKKKNLYITYIGKKKKRVKTATKGHKKRGYFVAPK